jgi:hypothetical protein
LFENAILKCNGTKFYNDTLCGPHTDILMTG